MPSGVHYIYLVELTPKPKDENSFPYLLTICANSET